MSKHLYFICPTDHLEPIINKTSHHENYFFTSLGNSLTFDYVNIQPIIELIKSKNISHITFVLSNANRIVSDALEKQDFTDITSLENFYDQITRQNSQAATLWHGYDHQLLVLSFYLNHKIKELKTWLNQSIRDSLTINAKVYNRRDANFNDVYPECINVDFVSVN